ncbi:hypothetical protein H8A97_30405 [Bradyrhizobium sp. Arg62]|uniref:hypothetical protein n=1 Tax=Bradyrhizobium brasilense TaxID=1419277 RepID=UPI001E645066|nr:hypothetical protein [Bradyrhizobium brasilense]MCC8949298.1 hypothetical protein [Bradyrhizobium brasilense]
MPPFVKDVGIAFRASVRFAEVLGEIARGRKELAAETARQMAREVLDEQGFEWPPRGNLVKREPLA